MSLRIKKGDMVRVISGSELKGKGRTGRVLAVFPRQSRAIVEGVNLVKKHQKPRSQQDPGGIIEKEAPVHMSNLMLAEASGERAGRFQTREDKNGNKVRVLKLGDTEKEVIV
jgi:large subunit ribosomal protein L24